MKTGIVCAIIFVALINGLDGTEFDALSVSEDIRICQPGDTKMDECNSCYCNADGSRWACTKMLCIPDSTYQDGTDAQSDPTKLINRPVRQLKDSSSCVPNSTFKMQCNTCFCSSDGRIAGCTLKFCTD